MYLYDYQRTTLSTIRYRGCSFIIQGPRRIGMEVMMANYVLMSATDIFESHITVICPRQDIAMEFSTKKIPIALFDAKQNRYAIFDHTVEITQQRNGHITLSNGSEIRVISAAALSNIGYKLDWLNQTDIVVIDSSNMISNLDQVLTTLAEREVPTIIMTLTGGMDEVTNRVYVDSIKGKNNFQYIRIPVDVLPKGSYNNLMKMKDTLSDKHWNSDIEMVPNIKREPIP